MKLVYFSLSTIQETSTSLTFLTLCNLNTQSLNNLFSLLDQRTKDTRCPASKTPPHPKRKETMKISMSQS